MFMRRLARSLPVHAVLLAACSTDPPAGGDTGSSDTGSSDTGGSTATSSPTDPTDPTSTSGPTDPTSSSTDPGTSTTTSTTTTDTDTTTGEPGLSCPLDGQPGVEQLMLAPLLFGEGADASAAPSCTYLNPERGFHQPVSLRSVGADTLEQTVAAGMSVIYGQVLIPEYRDKPLDDALLDEIHAGFDLVRAHGMKVVPRFHYSNAGDEPDAPLAIILGHIDQLAPVLQEHADVILTVQAGFIGAWGEWHSSQNGLDAPGPRKQVLDALLAALPPDRTITVRRPSFKQAAYGGPVTEATAHDGSALARIGHLNDCFLASDDDFGTYEDAAEKDYAIADSPFVPVGGETCAVNPPRSECPSALDELALLHWTHLNVGYHPDVLDAWKEDGCYTEVACRLGYRLAVKQLRYAHAATPGGVLPVSFDIHNDGFAAPVNARPLVLVLDGPSRVEVPVQFDLRDLLPGTTSTVCVDAALPADSLAGFYRIGLRLPDPAPTLADDPRQAIRLGNDDVVEWSDGINWFDAMIAVE
ncbi:MAG TPA: DUF4832 domain-containing protein [Nannocystis sp.]|jgi:hypothetical protein